MSDSDDLNEKQLRALRVLFNGFSVSDASLCLVGYWFALLEILHRELARGLVMSPIRETVSRTLMLALLFLFEVVYQVHVGLAYGITRDESRIPRVSRHKRIVALCMTVWAFVGWYHSNALKDALIAFVVANVLAGALGTLLHGRRA